MPEYLAPGVYVEEVDMGPPPIEGVSTSTAGFVGATELGPTRGVPTLVTSMTDFATNFGGHLPDVPWAFRRFLAYAVQGFFENGGKRAYISRVVGAGAAASSLDLPSGWTDAAGPTDYLLTQLADEIAAGTTQVMLSSSRGIEVGTQLELMQPTAATPLVSPSFAVTAVDGDTVTVDDGAGGGVDRAYDRRALVRFAAPAGVSVAPALTVTAANEGAWGDRIRVQARPSSRSNGRLLASGIGTSVVGEALAVPGLALAGAPAADNATLNPGQAQRLRVGDGLLFAHAPDADEVRQIVSFGAGATPAPTAGDDRVNVAPDLPASHQDATTTVALDNPPDVGIRAIPGTNVEFAVASTTDLSAGGQITIDGGGNSEATTIAAVPDATHLSADVSQDFPAGSTVMLQGAGVGAVVRATGALNLYPGAALELTDAAGAREYREVVSLEGDRITLDQALPGSFVAGDRYRSAEFDLIVQRTRTNPRTRRLEVLQEEQHTLLSTADGAFNNVRTVVGENSELVGVATDDAAGNPLSPNDAPFNFPTTLDGDTFSTWRFLAGGNDGAPPTDADYRGSASDEPGDRTGIAALADVDAISIIAAPGIASESVHRALIGQCEELKDRFAVLDPPRGRSPAQVSELRLEYDTRYAALYYPWFAVTDALGGPDLAVPPSGHVIGIYARTDNERGVHKAPANAVVRGATELERVITKGQQDILNPPPNQINVIRDFRSDGRGIRVWGARCITSDAQWKYVNVRRLFIYLEESIDQGTQWVVFEPNDARLWKRVEQSVRGFLTAVWRDGALMGATPEQAFFVRCDETTMTPYDRENGRLIMIVGVAPVYPAEFVIIRIGQWTGGSSIEELTS